MPEPQLPPLPCPHCGRDIDLDPEALVELARETFGMVPGPPPSREGQRPIGSIEVYDDTDATGDSPTAGMSLGFTFRADPDRDPRGRG